MRVTDRLYNSVMKKLTKKEIIAQDHRLNGGKGGRALFKKVGPDGMRALVAIRWAKRKKK